MLIRWADLIVLLLMIAFFLSRLLFVVCFAMVIRWAGSFLLRLLIRLAILIRLLLLVSRQLLLSCSSETALVLLAILLRSSLVLLDVFVILLGCCPFAIVLRVILLGCRPFAILLRAAILDLLVRQECPLRIYDHNVSGPKAWTWN